MPPPIYALKPVLVRSRLTQGLEIPDIEFVSSRRDPRYLFAETRYNSREAVQNQTFSKGQPFSLDP